MDLPLVIVPKIEYYFSFFFNFQFLGMGTTATLLGNSTFVDDNTLWLLPIEKGF